MLSAGIWLAELTKPRSGFLSVTLCAFGINACQPSGIKTWAAYPGGQSGNPGSAFYANLLPRWVKGNYFQLLFLRSPDENIQKILYTTQLNPKTE